MPASGTTSPRTFRIDARHHLQQMLEENALALLGRSVAVTVAEDAVVLAGQVNTWHEKQIVQESLRVMVGSRRIMNQLSVES
jgi:hypothetical protein